MSVLGGHAWEVWPTVEKLTEDSTWWPAAGRGWVDCFPELLAGEVGVCRHLLSSLDWVTRSTFRVSQSECALTQGRGEGRGEGEAGGKVRCCE